METVACVVMRGENFPILKSALLVTERHTLTSLFGLLQLTVPTRRVGGVEY